MAGRLRLVGLALHSTAPVLIALHSQLPRGQPAAINEQATKERETWARGAAARKPQTSAEMDSGCCIICKTAPPLSSLPFPSHPTLPNSHHQLIPSEHSIFPIGQPHILLSNSAPSPFKAPGHLLLHPQILLQVVGHILNLGPVWNWGASSSLLVSLHDLLSFQVAYLLKCSQRTLLWLARPPHELASSCIFQVEPFLQQDC